MTFQITPLLCLGDVEDLVYEIENAEGALQGRVTCYISQKKWFTTMFTVVVFVDETKK